jgi:hypothetical protein
VGWAALASLAVLFALAVLVYADVPSEQADPEIGPETLLSADPPSSGQQLMSIKAVEGTGQRFSVGGGIAGFPTFFSGFEPPCDPDLHGNGYIGGGGSGLPQNCDWHTSTGAMPNYRQPHIDTVNPLTDLQHLRFQHDPNQPQTSSSRNWAFSDDIDPTPDEGVAHLSLDLLISATGGQNRLIIQPQAPTQGLLTTVMNFETDGTITVGDDNGNCDDDLFAPNNPTGATWTPGVYKRVDICVDTVNDRIRYFYDGIFIYSTGAGEGGVGGPLGCGVFAGSIIEHVLIRWDTNFNDGRMVDVDNVTIEEGNCPEPTGACCNFDGQGGCDVLNETECAATPGTFGGIGTACDPAFCDAVIACEGASGDCFQENATPGCDDPECCVLVCVEDPFCCEDTWDAECVSTAETACVFLTCDHSGTSCQEISTSNASTSMDDSFQVAEKFTPAASGNVNSICWYGAYLPADLPNIGDDSFTVRYYDCVDGVPTNVIAEFTQGVGLSINDKHTTNLLVAGLANIFEYTATHADVPVTQGEAYFLEIVNSGLGGTTWFWEWGFSPNGDSEGYQKQIGLPYARYFRIGNDLAFCLNLELADVGEVCPVPAAVPCELDVAGADVEEGEPCGADPDQNIGCSADAPPFLYTDLASVSTDPADPTVIHGEAYADGGTRDVDWYRFTAPDVDANQDGEAVVCLLIASELPMAAVVVTDDPQQGECVDPTIPGLDAIGFECGASLAVGYTIANMNEQLILARTADGQEIFFDFPCAGPTYGSDYLMEVAVVDTFEECFPVEDTCPWDLNGDDFVGINDLLVLLANWGPNPGHPADFNGDDFVGINDLLALLANWGNCPQ